jgi:hypothetical protein
VKHPRDEKEVDEIVSSARLINKPLNPRYGFCSDASEFVKSRRKASISHTNIIMPSSELNLDLLLIPGKSDPSAESAPSA